MAPAVPKADEQMQVTICGGGNSTHVMAALLGSKDNITVNIFDVMEEEVAKFNAAFTETKNMITVKQDDKEIKGRVAKISSKGEDVIPGSNLIILAVPAFAHQIYLEAAAPYVEDDMMIGVMVAQGGADWCARSCLGEKLKRTTFFAFETLPWACRIEDFAKIADILGCKKTIDMAVTPPENFEAAATLLNVLMGTPEAGGPATELYPKLTQMPNFMSATLMNINSVWHPTISYGRFHSWDKKTPFPEELRFYEGVDDFTADALTNVSNEVLAIRAAVEARFPGVDLTKVTHVRDWMLRSYGDDIADKSSLRSAIVTNKGYKGLNHPMLKVEGGYVPNAKYRYYSEDLPFGLVVTRGVGELLEVSTPNMDAVIVWGQEMLGKEYLVNGKLVGKDVASSRAPQRYGVTLEHLLEGAGLSTDATMAG